MNKICFAIIVASSPYTQATIEQTLLKSHTSFTGILNESKANHLTPHEIVLWLKEQELPISAIAEIARVERKSVYSWLNFGGMNILNQERLEQIYELLSSLDYKLFDLYSFWNRKIRDEYTLKTLLGAEILNPVLIKEVLIELDPLVKARVEFNKRYPKNPSGINQFLEET